MRKANSLWLIFSLLHGTALPAAENTALRMHEAHVHGQVRLNIAAEGDGVIAIELESPAVNLLGFEHAPATEKELALVEKVRRRLLDHASIVEFTGESCIQEDTASEFSIQDEEHAHAESTHEHEEEGHDERHRNIHIQYRLKCRPGTGLDASFTAFADFPGIEEVIVQWITESGQGRAVMTRDTQSLHLE